MLITKGVFFGPAACADVFFEQIQLTFVTVRYQEKKARESTQTSQEIPLLQAKPSSCWGSQSCFETSQISPVEWEVGEETFLCSQLSPDKALVWLVVTNINYADKYSLHVSVLHAFLPPATLLIHVEILPKENGIFFECLYCRTLFATVRKEVCISKKKPFCWCNT